MIFSSKSIMVWIQQELRRRIPPQIALEKFFQLSINKLMEMPVRRLGSIDVIRALTMYFMVFVNDLWTDRHILSVHRSFTKTIKYMVKARITSMEPSLRTGISISLLIDS